MLSTCVHSVPVDRVVFSICFGVVLWQLYSGTIKYLDSPTSSSTYHEPIELPELTVCHQWGFLAYDVPNFGDYINGQFSTQMYQQQQMNEGFDTIRKSWTPEQIYEVAVNQFYYLLDERGKFPQNRVV